MERVILCDGRDAARDRFGDFVGTWLARLPQAGVPAVTFTAWKP